MKKVIKGLELKHQVYHIRNNEKEDIFRCFKCGITVTIPKGSDIPTICSTQLKNVRQNKR